MCKATTYSDVYDFDCEAILIAGNGEVGLSHHYHGKFQAYQRTYVLCNFKEVRGDFLKYVIDCNLIPHLKEQTHGAAIPYIKKGGLSSCPVPIPPLPEQERIVAKLDAAFAAIDQAKANVEQNLQNTKELFQSKLNEVFSQKGDGWVEKKLGDEDLVQIIDGDRGKNYPSKADFLSEGYCVFMNTGNVRPNGFDFREVVFISEKRDKLLRKGKLKRNDVVMTTRGTIGNLGLYDDAVPHEHVRINSGMLVFRPNVKQILPEYLFEVFRSPIITEQIKSHTTGAAQPQLPIKTLVNFNLQVPNDLQEQAERVKEIRAVEQLTNQLQTHYTQKLMELEELKKSLLERAFRGEI